MDVRRLLFIVFAALALAVIAALAVAGRLILEAAATETATALGEVAIAAGAVAVVVVVGLIALAWLAADRAIAAPTLTLARDLRTLVHANPERAVDFRSARRLGELATTLEDLVAALVEARGRVAHVVAEATARAEELTGRLEAILRDLHEGVVVCNLNHQILLYNRRALELLHVGGELGLGRPLFSLVKRQPFLHALQSLTARLGEEAGAAALAAPFLASTVDGRSMLQGRMSLIRDARGAPVSYVITFDDKTQELAALGRRDHLLREATEGLRRPVANLRAAVETIAGHGAMAPAERASFEAVIAAETASLSERLEALAAEYRSAISGHWPMADFYSADLLNTLAERLSETAGMAAVMTGIPRWMHGDSYTLLELLEGMIRRVHRETGAGAFDLEAASGERHVYIDVLWSGAPVSAAAIESWLGITLEGAPGALTARDVLEHHRSTLWSEPAGSGRARLRLPLKRAMPRPAVPRAPLPARPEFYDFDLLNPQAALEAKGAMALKALTYVVFDSETTGLRPSEGDEMVSIAGVRVVNGRILTGESFSRLVNPGRPIPRQSIRFHGITDDMVRDKPPARVILPQFRKFAADAVLVAHNAAFDIRFLRIKEGECGVVFDNPVLDTLLLSVFLDDHATDHTLEGMAERFGVEIESRHTALGDALATAAIFLRMIDLLEAVGVRTLDDAVAASNRMVAVRARQAEF